MKNINVGIVGFGNSAKHFHAPFLHVNPNFTIKKIVERHSKKSKEIYPYVEIVKNVDDLLNDKEIELIILTTPNTSHFELAKNILNTDKHLIIEKPITVGFSEADQLIKLSKQKNLLLSVYQNRRWDGDFLTIKKLIKEKTLGEVVEFESHFDRFKNYIQENAWREKPEPGSGVFYDLGVHLIDQVVQLFGIPQSITADIFAQRVGAEVDDNFEVIFHYPKVKAKMKAGMLYKIKHPRFALYGTNGSYIKYGLDPQEAKLKNGEFPDKENFGVEAEKDWGEISVESNGNSNSKKLKTLPGDYTKFYKNIYNVLENNAELEVKPEQARDVLKLIEISFLSSKEKRTIKVQDLF